MQLGGLLLSGLKFRCRFYEVVNKQLAGEMSLISLGIRHPPKVVSWHIAFLTLGFS